MSGFDLKYYLSVFWRRFPYFLVIAAFISAIGLTVAFILPPSYRSTARLLVESAQIPGDLAQSTVPVNAVEQIEIIQQRLMTRANLLSLADRFDMYSGKVEMSADDIVKDMEKRVTFMTDVPMQMGRRVEGATIISASFDAPTPGLAADVTNEITTLILQENVALRTGRATGTLDFFEQEVNRLSGDLDRNAAAILEFKNANQDALPESLEFRRNEQTLNQERLIQLEREEASLRDARARTVSIYEQTGRVFSDRQLSREEQQLADLRLQLDQALAVYSETSPNVTMLKNRIATLEPVVKEQLALINPDFLGMSEYEIQLAQIDGRLEFLAGEKAKVATTLSDLDRSIRETPGNEMVLAGLQREQESLRAQYSRAENRLGEAAVGERIEVLAKGERFTLVEQATPPQDPVSPNRLLIGGGSVGAGFGAGLGLILLMELLNRSIRRPVEITSRLGIQPLATIPYIRTSSETRRKRGVMTGSLGADSGRHPVGAVGAAHLLPADRSHPEQSRGQDRAERFSVAILKAVPQRSAGGAAFPGNGSESWNAFRLQSRRPRSSVPTAAAKPSAFRRVEPRRRPPPSRASAGRSRSGRACRPSRPRPSGCAGSASCLSRAPTRPT